MVASPVTRALALGDRPTTSAWVLVAGLAVAAVAVSLRFVAPMSLYSQQLLLLVAVVGGLLAVVAGRYGGGVLVALLVAALPVFAFDAAATAVTEPITFSLLARAASSAAGYSFVIAGLLTGPLGYAIGATTRPGDGLLNGVVRFDRTGDGVTASFRFSTARARAHLRVDRAHYGPLLAWTLLATGVVVAWLVLPISTTPASIAAAPVLVAGGLVVATILGYRARGALPAVVAGGISGSAGLKLFTFGNVALAAGASPSVAATGRIVLAGFALGAPLGLVGYAIGRVLRAASGYHGTPART